MIRLQIFNETSIKVDYNSLYQTAKKVFKILNIKNAQLNLIFVNKNFIKKLNKVYRHKNQPTDVLSFKNNFDFEIFSTLNFLGEIFICLPIAKIQAKQKKHSLLKELTVLFAHGILHLAGYDHEKSKRDAKKMKEIEESI